VAKKKPGSTTENQSTKAETKLSPGQILNQAEYDVLPFKEPTKNYLILSSQRVGSNYLSRRLCNVKNMFGLPSEYLNSGTIEMMLPRLLAEVNVESHGKPKVGLLKYMKAIQRARTTEDGYFGIKVQPHQIFAVTGKKKDRILGFINSFDRVVLMTRQDKLGQAISGALAQATGVWFNQDVEHELDDAQIKDLFPMITRNLSRYFEEEQFILSVGKAISKPLLRIQYEEIEANGDAAFASLVDFLAGAEGTKVEEDTTFAAVPEKPSSALAEKIRHAFIAFISGNKAAA
jgi:LPS sulfotransferase NodH